MKKSDLAPKIGNARFCILKNNRIVIAPSSQFKSDQRVLLDATSKQIKIHPSIYSISGRSHIEVLWLSIQKKSSGYYMACADIKKAFPSTHLEQMKKILRSDGISAIYDDILGLNTNAIRITNSKKTYRGLAQGLPASSMLHARYISKALSRFTEFKPYGSIAVWCDDIYIFGKTRKAVVKSLKEFSWQLKKLDNISKIHKTNQKAPKIFCPDEVWPVLGFKIGGTMISKKTNEEPIVKHENALHLLNSIKKLKELALKAEDQQVLRKLEELLPTTPIPSIQPTDKSNDWMKIGFPNFNSPYYYNRRRGQGNSTFFDQRFSREAAGVGCSVTFPSLAQAELNKRFSIDCQKMNNWYSQFIHDPIRYSQIYIHLRNELWAFFIAFYGSGSLSQLWHTNKENLVATYKTRNPQAVIEIRSAYINELRMIDSGVPLRLKPLELKISDESLKCILRGYVTSLMIFLETNRSNTLIPACEFEIGRFRYPTLGFDTTEDFEDDFGNLRCSASEINDLGEIADIFESGIGTLESLKYVITRLIERKKNAPLEGIFISIMREPVGALYYEYFEDLAIGSNQLDLQSRMKACEATYFCSSKMFSEIADRYGLQSIALKRTL